MNTYIKNLTPHFIAVVVFVILSCIYFMPQLQGKKINQGDIIQFRGAAQESIEYKERTGENTLWTNSMFGGMPTYQIRGISDGNYIKPLQKVLKVGFPRPIGVFISLMLCFYIMMVCMGVNHWLSIIGAVGFGLATNNLILFEAGHNSKLVSVGYLPLMAAGIILAYRSKILWGSVIFGFGAALNLVSNHIQMTYIFLLTMVFYFIATAYAMLKDPARKAIFLKATGGLAIAGLLALGSTSSNYLSTWQYGNETIRGNPILEPTGAIDPSNSSQTEGLAWDYAMRWSNSWEDVMSGLIPGVAGGGSGEYVGKESASYKSLRAQGYNAPTPLRVSLYHGALPFTSGPIYFGAIMVFLFLIGAFIVKGPYKWWLVIGTLFTILLSMGKNLEFFNKPMFDLLPLMNKFRAPNSLLSVTTLLIPLLAIVALDKLTKLDFDKKKVEKIVLGCGGVLSLICLYYLVLGSGMDLSNPSDASRAPFKPEDLIADRKSLMLSDSLRTLALIAIATGGLVAFLRGKISKYLLYGVIGVLVLFDVWSVGQRYLNKDTFVSERQVDATFTARPADTQILADPDPHYRVFDITSSPFITATASYFHKSIGGNHAAKLQRYNDIIDKYLDSRPNENVLNMLNTKYFIVGQPGQENAQRNEGALGNAWLVSGINTVPNANAEIDAIATIDVSQQAIVHQEFTDYVSGLNPTGQGSISLTSYAPNKFCLLYTSPSPRD